LDVLLVEAERIRSQGQQNQDDSKWNIEVAAASLEELKSMIRGGCSTHPPIMRGHSRSLS
jgi:hypothetical protein